MNGIRHLVQFSFEFQAICWILIPGFEHQINSTVEFAAGVGQILGLIKSATRLERAFRVLNCGVRFGPAAGNRGSGQNDGWRVGLQVHVVFDRRRFSEVDCRRVMRGRREE
ncbi:MAG TPA: hypothetical protein VNV86_08875 [Candidatus Acidoferrum sp.]|nr:hypothetical protein [Candidatus Acidoferrum sp.]